MMAEMLYDISEICTTLHTTSRTLRFYEEKGIISSVRSSSSPRRRYTEEQAEEIRNVLILRKLGLSLRDIQNFRKHDRDLKSVLLEKRAEIGALIETKLQEITLLNQALVRIEKEGGIPDCFPEPVISESNSQILEMLKTCTEAIIYGTADTLYPHLSPTMQAYMPVSAFQRMREDTLKPLGTFQFIDKLECDSVHPGVFHQYIRYERLGLVIRYTVIAQEIHGLWMGYYEPERRQTYADVVIRAD